MCGERWREVESAEGEEGLLFKATAVRRRETAVTMARREIAHAVGRATGWGACPNCCNYILFQTELGAHTHTHLQWRRPKLCEPACPPLRNDLLPPPQSMWRSNDGHLSWPFITLLPPSSFPITTSSHTVK